MNHIVRRNRKNDYDRDYSRNPSVKEIAEKAGISEKLAQKTKENIEDMVDAKRWKRHTKHRNSRMKRDRSWEGSSSWNDIRE